MTGSESGSGAGAGTDAGRGLASSEKEDTWGTVKATNADLRKAVAWHAFHTMAPGVVFNLALLLVGAFCFRKLLPLGQFFLILTGLFMLDATWKRFRLSFFLFCAPPDAEATAVVAQTIETYKPDVFDLALCVTVPLVVGTVGMAQGIAAALLTGGGVLVDAIQLGYDPVQED
jgi:hypothetical protein